MANLGLKNVESECRAALNYATELRLFARKKAPNAYLENLTQKVATKIQTSYGESQDLKMERVVAMLKKDGDGASTSVSELVERFGWRRQKVDDVVNSLLAEEPARVEMVIVRGNGAGRPARRLRLKSP